MSHPVSTPTIIESTTTTTSRTCLMKEPRVKTAFQNIITLSVNLICHLIQLMNLEENQIYNKVSNKFVQQLFLTNKYFQINFKKLSKAWKNFRIHLELFPNPFGIISKCLKKCETYQEIFSTLGKISKYIRTFFQRFRKISKPIRIFFRKLEKFINILKNFPNSLEKLFNYLAKKSLET